ncbi:molybdopterin-dependent oxidoreductase [Celeribacter baekdonensis]|nr:molybdopterin-dependent oxidoreductase [Celeribacter baekdonensis]
MTSDLSQSVTLRGYCSLCKSRCGAIYTVQGDRLTGVAPDPDHPTGGAMCAKGRALPELLHHPDRLRTPLRRTTPKGSTDPGWVEIGWDEALDEITSRMAAIRDAHGAEAVAFACTTPSGSALSDSLDWILRLIWQFGSPNLIAAVEVCNFQKDYGQELTFGKALGMPDYDQADIIVLWGQNPTRTWLAQAQRIAEARRRGAKLVVIDPKRAGSGEQADLWLRIRPGTDAALAMGAIRHLLMTDRFATGFVREWTDAAFLIDRDSGDRLTAAEIAGPEGDGFVIYSQVDGVVAVDPRAEAEMPGDTDLFFDGTVVDKAGRSRQVASALALLRKEAEFWNLPQVAATTGIEPAALSAFFDLLAGPGRLSYYHWTGFAQAGNATLTTRAVSSLFALRDDVDAEGGNRWLPTLDLMRIAEPALLSANQRSRALALDRLPLGPPRHGFATLRDVCQSIEGEAPNRVRMLFNFGSNLLTSQPDAQRTRRALSQLEFQVHCDQFMTPTAEMADIVLPVAAPLEHDTIRLGFEITERAAGHVQFRPALLSPPGSARADHQIARALARRLELEGELWSLPLDEALDRVLAPSNLSVAKLRATPEGITLPLQHVSRGYAQSDAEGRRHGFATPTGRVEFHSTQMHAHGYPSIARAERPAAPDPRNPVQVTTAKSGYFTHSSLRNLVSLRRRAPDPSVDLGPELAERHGLMVGDWVILSTQLGSVRLRVRIDPLLADGVAIAEYGWWQGCEAMASEQLPVTGVNSSNINAVISDVMRDPISGAPPLRQFFCAIERDEAASLGNWQGSRAFVVVQHEIVGGDILRLGLRPEDGGALPCFHPGQHIGIAVPGVEGRRFYSLNTDGAVAVRWELAIRRGNADAGMSISCHLHDHLRQGDRLMLTAPAGSFCVPASSTRPVVCVAGGIGITPFLSAFRAAGRGEGGGPIHLHYLARNVEAAVFHEELAALAAGQGRMSFDLWLKDGALPEAPWAHHGSGVEPISTAIDQELLDRRPLFYLCGPAGMMEAMRKVLVARGVPAADILSEAFKSEVALPDDIGPATVTLERSGQSFQWEASDGSILAAASAAGISLPSGCQVGQCESCAVRVVSGRFHCATESELGTDQCLTCQSVPLGDLTLDL